MLDMILGCVYLSVIACVVHIICDKLKTKWYHRPPALPSLPFVGSLPFLCQPDKLHELFMRKSVEYGNVFSFNAGSRYTVVINGLQAIRDALLIRAHDVAGRAEIYVERHAFNSLGRGIIFRNYDDRLRKNRSHSLSILKQFGLGTKSRIESIIHNELEYVLEYIQSNSGKSWDPTGLLELSTMNIIHKLMFGARLEYEDEQAEYIRSTVRRMADAIDALYDFFPVCAYLPRWRKNIEDLKPVGENMRVFLAERINKYRRNNGQVLKNSEKSHNNENHEQNKSDKLYDQESAGSEHEENFISEFLSREDNMYEGSEEELNFILRDLLAGGTDTTSGQLGWALILLANHPRVQQRAHGDIDRVVGPQSLPSLDDRARLPYLEALMMEAMRLRTAVPLGAPRLTITDTCIAGYNVPKHTMLLLNFWSAHMDTTVWDDPSVFRPERFLNDDEEIINKEKLITFSLGKRCCPGELLARHEMFLYLATLLQRYHILPPEGCHRVSDEPHIVRVCTPAPYEIRFVDRLSE